MADDEYETIDGESTEEFTSLPRGTRQLGPYLLLSEIGRGAMGTVYEAEHTNLKRRVALKVLPEELATSADRYARFQREMQAIGRLEHPNIVLATDAGQVDGVCYIAMQLIQGVDLSRILVDHGKIPVHVACEIVRQVALGLAEIHTHGMVHRDIKPSNLLLATNGEVKILDLGIASLRQSPTASDSLTMTGSFLGTPDYVAPEQITNAGPIDIRADIYSLGCTLYHLIGGQAPFSGEEYSSFPAKLLGHAERKPEPLDAKALKVPHAVLDIIDRMMAKDPNDRFSAPAEVAAALEENCDAKTLDALALTYGDTVRLRGKPRNTDGLDTELQDTPELTTMSPKWLATAAALAGLALLLVVYAGWTAVNSIAEQTAEQAAWQKQFLGEQQTTGRQQLGTTQEMSRNVGAIRESTSTIADSATKLDASVTGMAADTKSVADNTGKIVHTLEQLQADFSKVVDRLNEDPQSPSEWYANALVHSKSGNALEARRAFLEFLRFDLNVIDPYRKLAVLLRVQEGLAGARETFAALPGDKGLPARRLVAISLSSEEERPALLRELLAQEPDFTPAYLDLVKTQGDEFGAFISLREQLERRQTIEKYLQQHEAGKLLRFYLDQTQAAADVAMARQLLARSPQVTQEHLDNPVEAQFLYGAEEFIVFLTFAERVQNAAYRLPQKDEFTMFAAPLQAPAGAYARMSQSLAKQMTEEASLSNAERIEIPADTPSGDIELKYEDCNGVPCGPFKIKFDPEKIRYDFGYYKVRGNGDNQINGAPVHEDWVDLDEGWRETDPDEISFLGLLRFSWRAIESARYGVNVGVPDRELRIPKSDKEAFERGFCDIEVAEQVRFVTLQVTFVDGYTTEVHRYEME